MRLLPQLFLTFLSPIFLVAQLTLLYAIMLLAAVDLGWWGHGMALALMALGFVTVVRVGAARRLSVAWEDGEIVIHLRQLE